MEVRQGRTAREATSSGVRVRSSAPARRGGRRCRRTSSRSGSSRRRPRREADVAGGATASCTCGWGRSGRSSAVELAVDLAQDSERRVVAAEQDVEAVLLDAFVGASTARPCPQSPAPLVDRDGVQPPPPVARAQLPGRRPTAMPPPRMTTRAAPGRCARRSSAAAVSLEAGRRQVTSIPSTVRQSSGSKPRVRGRVQRPAGERPELPGAWRRARPRSGRRPPRGVLAGSE